MKAAEVSMKLWFLPIPSEIADEARANLKDRFGHRLCVTGTLAPCRLCLQVSKEPEDFILLSYQPLPDTGPYAEVGPIFVHARRCRAYANRETFPPDFISRPLVLRSYDRAGNIHDSLVAAPGEAEQHAVALLEEPAAVEVHARHVSHTCFDFKIVRAGAEQATNASR